MTKKTCFLILTPMLALVLHGCVATSTYYSGRTLEEKKLTVLLAADDIVLKNTDQSIEITKKTPITPSLGITYGLPLRMEIGLRYLPPRFIEASLRHQVNPLSFEMLDCSLNAHFGHVAGEYSYLKYGITVSKNINEVEPFVNYFNYHFVGTYEGDFKDFISGAVDDFISRNHSIGVGIGLPLQGAKIFPEVDYQYFRGVKNGLWHFGMGIRIDTN